MANITITINNHDTGICKDLKTIGYFILTDDHEHFLCTSGGNLDFKLECAKQASKLANKALSKHLEELGHTEISKLLELINPAE